MVMYVLDTDHLSLMQRNGLAGRRILARLAGLSVAQVASTVISYEEQVKGRLLVLSQAQTAERVTSAYSGLQQIAEDYRSIALLPFDHTAFDTARQLRKRYRRLGAMDLKIAALAEPLLRRIVLAQDAILLTRNRSDFGQIEGLRWEDWSE
jgi:tRNA(fMet)-specific endonuclease VapC